MGIDRCFAVVKGNPLLQRYRGKLHICIETPDGMQNVYMESGSENALFDYVCEALPLSFAPYDMLFIWTSLSDWEVKNFDPMKRYLHVKKIGGTPLQTKR